MPALMFKGFWERIVKPIVGLAPMDGVTDAACRRIMAQYGKPDIVFTEFTHAQGLLMAPKRLLRDFEYCEAERPVIAQIYGHRPEDFYKATHVVCELGFDGVDINMGCPARKVVSRKCGAGLIREPDLAVEIMRAVKHGIRDWVGGQSLYDLQLSNKLIDGVAKLNHKRGVEPTMTSRCEIPFSVKTRLGHDEIVIEAWTETLLQESPAAISLHGRTLKQMYKGEADWEAIARAVRIAASSDTLVLGNGDIADLQGASQRILQTGVDGVLVGRSSIGNPWIFENKAAFKAAVQAGKMFTMAASPMSWEQRFEMAMQHARCLESLRGHNEYRGIRKHLAGYLREFDEASDLRRRAMQVNSADELESLLQVESENRQVTSQSEAGQTLRQCDPYFEAVG